MTPAPLQLVGIPDPTHVGHHLLNASATLPVQATLANVREAFAAPRLWRSFCWHLLGHRPPRLHPFSAQLLAQCQAQRPKWLLTTGLAPVNAATLHALRRLGITLINFLTDDPWNPQHRAPWFMQALPLYDQVFTPRQANLDQLRRLHHPAVHYLPFAYAPDVHFPPTPAPTPDTSAPPDVLFIGGADQDRIATLKILHHAGHKLSLWGGYWDRDRELAPYAHGHADPAAFRHLVATASVNLCLVRRANRDGHSMRTFELAAIGSCMLVEDTAEHRALFGPDLDKVAYFQDPASMVQQTTLLLRQPELRHQMATRVRQWATQGRHTYTDRLRTMLSL